MAGIGRSGIREHRIFSEGHSVSFDLSGHAFSAPKLPTETNRLREAGVQHGSIADLLQIDPNSMLGMATNTFRQIATAIAPEPIALRYTVTTDHFDEGVFWHNDSDILDKEIAKESAYDQDQVSDAAMLRGTLTVPDKSQKPNGTYMAPREATPSKLDDPEPKTHVRPELILKSLKGHLTLWDSTSTHSPPPADAERIVIVLTAIWLWTNEEVPESITQSNPQEGKPRILNSQGLFPKMPSGLRGANARLFSPAGEFPMRVDPRDLRLRQL